MVGDGWMFTSFYQAQKIAVTLLYKLKTVDLSCFYTEWIINRILLFQLKQSQWLRNFGFN